MNSYLRFCYILTATVAVSMFFRWLIHSASGIPYSFPEGWFVGMGAGLGVNLGDRWRHKHLKAVGGERPEQ